MAGLFKGLFGQGTANGGSGPSAIPGRGSSKIRPNRKSQPLQSGVPGIPGSMQSLVSRALNTPGPTAGQENLAQGVDAPTIITSDTTGFTVFSRPEDVNVALAGLDAPDWIEVEVESKVPDFPFIISRLSAWLDVTAKALHTSLVSNNTLALNIDTFTEGFVRIVLFNGLCVYANCVGDGALNPAKGRGMVLKFRKNPALSYKNGGDFSVLVSHLTIGKMIDRGQRTQRSVTIYRLAAVTYEPFALWAKRTKYVPNWFPAFGEEHTIPYEYRSLANTNLDPAHAESASAMLMRDSFDSFMMNYVPEEKRGRYSRDPTLEAQIARTAAAPQAYNVGASIVRPGTVTSKSLTTRRAPRRESDEPSGSSEKGKQKQEDEDELNESKTDSDDEVGKEEEDE